MLNRRSFLEKIVLAAPVGVGLLAPRTPLHCEPSSALPKSRSDTILYQGRYPGWPWITKSENGRLYAVFREGTRHLYSREGKVLLVKSFNKGKTWSAPTVVVDHPDIDDRNSSITALPGGRLIVFFNTYTSAKESQAMFTHSQDDGKTWTKPEPFDRANTRTRAGAILLQNGTLVLPYYLAPSDLSLAAVSNDKGHSWKTYEVPNTDGFEGDEWDILEVEPDRIIGIHRNGHAHTDGFFWKSESRDGGRTWSVPQKTNVQSRRAPSPAQIVFHGSAPTIIYADRRMVSVSAVTTTDPRFVNWDTTHRLECYRYSPDAQPIQDGSYPCSVSIDRDTRLIIDYEIRPDSKRIAGYFVKFPKDWGKTP